jgi:alkaline phosphatase
MTRLVALPVLLAVAACASPQTPAAGPPAATATGSAGPFSIVLFIGDGVGLEYWSAARLVSPEQSIDEFPVVGLVDTEASNSRITDSAAGATAYSAGVRTFNGAIGVGPDSTPVETVLERARGRGMATGLVATSTITHATPASFVAHVPSRNMHWAIAAEVAEADVDVILAGGRHYFRASERPDSADLMERLLRGATYVEDAATFRALDPDTVSRLVGMFAEENPPSAVQRAPQLSELTATALDVLAKDDDGFFLMVEGSQIDWRGHDNAPLRDVLAEMQDFDLAIRRALAFRDGRPNTLIVVVADHSTGGLAVHGDSTGNLAAHYTTDGHIQGMIPMFAIGPGAAAFAGVMNNDRVGRLLLDMVARAPDASRSGVITDTGVRWTPSSR